MENKETKLSKSVLKNNTNWIKLKSKISEIVITKSVLGKQGVFSARLGLLLKLQPVMLL